MSALRTARQYSGFTLVEMLVAIGTTSIVCALATALIFTMFRAEQSQTRDADERRAIQRLGGQFRRDIHAARSQMVFDDDTVLLRLSIDDDAEITYRHAGGNLVREVHRDDAVAAHDAFAIADRWQVSFAPAATDGLVQLTLDRTAVTERTRAPHRWQFGAALGRDHRHIAGTHIAAAKGIDP
jgi:type II secretory pathway pseudopilin PulG